MKDPPDPDGCHMELSPGGTSLFANFEANSDADVVFNGDSSMMSSIMKSSDNNFLPVVDQKTGVCASCQAKPDMEAFCLVCCGCSRIFHAICDDVNDPSNALLAPKKTAVASFNRVMKQNHSFKGGKFSWHCNSCVSIMNAKSDHLLRDRLSLIESSLAVNKPLEPLVKSLEKKISSLTQQLQAGLMPNYPAPPIISSFPAPPSFVSGPAPAETTYASMLQSTSTGNKRKASESNDRIDNKTSRTNSIQSASKSHDQICTEQQKNLYSSSSGGPRKSPTRFKFLVSSKDDGCSITSTLGKLIVEGKIPDYDFRVLNTGGVELFFDSLAASNTARDLLSSLLNANFVLGEPKLVSGKRYYLVGLRSYHEKDQVMQAITRNYSYWFDLDGANKGCFEIEGIFPCTNDPEKFRATIVINDAIAKIIKERLHNRLRFCMVTCNVYPVVPHKRCHRCQKHGHYRKDCKNPVACVKCGGNHDEKDCTADFERCVNCMNSTEFKDQYDHRADSPKCPVFLALREAELKNAKETLTRRN